MDSIKREYASFEELLGCYYGHRAVIGPVSAHELFAGYYGKPVVSRRPGVPRPALVLSLTVDDGEVLAQRRDEPPFDEYVVPGADVGLWAEEYVISPDPAPRADAIPVTATQPEAKFPVVPSNAATPPAEQRIAAPQTAEDQAQPAPTQAFIQHPISAGSGSAHPTEDDFVADLKSILSGKKVFDPVSKKTVDSNEVGGPRPAQAPPELPTPDSRNGQAIFDRIAQSMEFANAYDLGTVELENRFSDFDRVFELQRQAKEQKARGLRSEPEHRSMAASAAESVVGGADFIKDLDEIRAEHAAHSRRRTDWEASSDHDNSCAPAALSLFMAAGADAYSRPFYDTGEHVLTGGDLYPDQLRVGQNPGVAFSYGQLIAMADLYECVDQMMATDVGELTAVKKLIERSTSYYQGGKVDQSLNVSNEDWNKATGGRYLKLAESNYEHFSPDLFQDPLARTANKHGNNKSTWEAHHRRALEEAQRLANATESANRSVFPEWPLIINAFGDHFLTDAFASGHLINKEVMIAHFTANFYRGSSLTSAAEGFFERVAKLAFVGNVRKKFSALETVDYPVCIFGWCLMWHPNIDTVNAFRKMLTKAAEQEPLKVGNVVVKALHDRLNRDGVEVTNGAGDKPWPLTGDGFLNDQSLAVMRKAVQQSAANVNDPALALRAGGLDVASRCAKVWQFVPQLTPAARNSLSTLMKEYTDPGSTVLATAAAKIISDQVDSLIQVLINEGKLKPA
jgi:hypothetical protein